MAATTSVIFLFEIEKQENIEMVSLIFQVSIEFRSKFATSSTYLYQDNFLVFQLTYFLL